MKQVTQEEIFKSVSEIIGAAGVKYTNEDIYLVMGCVEQFKRSGYKFTFEEIATFLVSEKNMEMIEKEGLTKTILAMSRMKLGTIRVPKRPGRNDPCPCGKMKFKKCNEKTCQK